MTRVFESTRFNMASLIDLKKAINHVSKKKYSYLFYDVILTMHAFLLEYTLLYPSWNLTESQDANLEFPLRIIFFADIKVGVYSKKRTLLISGKFPLHHQKCLLSGEMTVCLKCVSFWSHKDLITQMLLIAIRPRIWWRNTNTLLAIFLTTVSIFSD